MKTLLATLIFVTSLILPGLADAEEITSEVEPDTTPLSCQSPGTCDKITVDGVIFEYQQEGLVHLRSGQEHKLGNECLYEHESLFTMVRTCSWKKVVKATDAGLTLAPGGTTGSESVPRLGKILAALLFALSLLVFIPNSNVVFWSMILLAAMSAVGLLGSGMEKSFGWAALFIVSVISALVATVATDEKWSHAYVYRFPPVIVTLLMLYLAP